MNRYLLPLLAATVIASGCASAPAPQAAATEAPAAKTAAAGVDSTKANAAISAAEKSRDAAAAAGYEWRDTSKLIDEAKKAAAAGNVDKAIALANQAERQGELAVKQQAIEMAKKH